MVLRLVFNSTLREKEPTRWKRVGMPRKGFDFDLYQNNSRRAIATPFKSKSDGCKNGSSNWSSTHEKQKQKSTYSKAIKDRIRQFKDWWSTSVST